MKENIEGGYAVPVRFIITWTMVNIEEFFCPRITRIEPIINIRVNQRN